MSKLSSVAIAVAAAATSVLVAVPAHAAPRVIQVAERPWGLVQDNGYYVMLTLSQTGPNLTGSASASHGPMGDTVLSSGNLTGTVTDRHIHFEIPWAQNDSIGEYDADSRPTTDGDGRIYFVGTTYDKSHPGAHAGWYADWSFAQP